jgi:outer membrane protein assembly factor BamB
VGLIGLALLAQPSPAALPRVVPVAEVAAENPDDPNGAGAALAVLNRDRTLAYRLGRARQDLEAGEASRGLNAVQQMLDLPEDVFFLGEDGRIESLRTALNETIAGLNADQYKLYLGMAEPDADRLLADARESGKAHLYSECVRRYFQTPAGFAAADELATLWMDRGDFSSAVVLWEQLLADPRHRRRFTPALCVKAAAAAWLAGDSAAESRFLRIWSGEQVRVGGRLVGAADWPPSGWDWRTVAGDPRGTSNPPRWPVLDGNSRRVHNVSASLPLVRADWSHPFNRNNSSLIEQLFNIWLEERRDSLRPLVAANFPVVVENTVYYRDSLGIRGFDLTSGRDVWRYDADVSAERILDEWYREIGGSRVRRDLFFHRPDWTSLHAANSVLGSLSSDGRRIYAIETIEEQPGPDGRDGPANRLIALPLKTKSGAIVEPVWVAGGAGGKGQQRGESESLAGHTFRCPPLPVSGGLLVLTEFEERVNLVLLDPATGGVLSQQGLAFIDAEPTRDVLRTAVAMFPAATGSMAVCPTDAGVLIGVDFVRGMLLWSYTVSDPTIPAPGQFGRRRTPQQGEGEPGFGQSPHIHGGRVAVLSHRSDLVHCLDLRTGRPLWTAPREDADYIGTITDEVVLLVGRRYCRGLSPRTGELLWSVRYGMPAGRGFASGSRYLLPLQDGRVVAIDLASGRDLGASPAAELEMLTVEPDRSRSPRPQFTLGHLIPAGERIVSSNVQGVAILPQTEPLLAEVRRQAAGADAPPAARLLAAELELTLGRLAAARSDLDAVDPAALDDEGQVRFRHLSRAALFRELDASPNNEQQILAKLDVLAQTPGEKAVLVLRRADAQLRRQDVAGVLTSAETLAALPPNMRLTRPDDPTVRLAPGAAARWLVDSLRSNLDADGQRRLAERVRGELARLAATDDADGDADGLVRFLAVYGWSAEADAVRVRLAQRHIARGRPQTAELLLLRCVRDPQSNQRAQAAAELARLYARLNIPIEAARVLARAEEQGLAGVADRLDEAARRELAPARRSFAKPGPVGAVRIHARRDDRAETWLTESFGQFRRRFALPHDLPFHILDKGTEPEGQVTLIDRATGVVSGRLAIPTQNSFPSLAKGPQSGHMIPVGGPGVMLGMSLLEHSGGEPAWSVKPQSPIPTDETLRVGPSGLGFCAFQSRQMLHVLDPATGHVLWERELADPAVGLMSDPYGGLIGDDEVLVLFDADRQGYTVYRTADGEELRRGRLDLDTNQVRRIFGRKLFYVATPAAGRRMRIWDPLGNRLEFDEPAGPRVFSAVTPDNELIVLLPPNKAGGDGRLQIRDVEASRVLVEVAITPEELGNLNYLRAFRHFDRWYVNLQRPVPMPTDEWFSYYASDTFLSTETVQGELLAVDAESGRVLWRKSLPQRSLMRTPFFRLPFLVAFSRIRDRHQGGRQALLVELIDPATGETIAVEHNIPPDRIIHAEYDPDRRNLVLFGLRGRIEIDFQDLGVPRDGEPL